MSWEEQLTCIEIMRKYYPKLASEGYTLYANYDRPLSEEKIKEIKQKVTGENRFWDNKYFMLTGEIIVGTIYDARWGDANGTISDKLVPVFAKYKKIKKKKTHHR